MSGLKNVRHRRSDALTQVGWDQLESMLAVYYRGQGYEVEHCGTAGTASRFDGGIDLKLRRDGAYLLVQCKHWNAKQVPHNEVHQLIGLMVNEEATGAILVTSGEFTRAAIEAAAKQGRVQLVDGDDLRRMLGPLPVAAVPGIAWTPSPVVAQAASSVGQRMLGALEDRIRKGAAASRQRGRGRGAVGSTRNAALWTLLLKGVFGLLLFLMMTAMLQSVVKSVMPASRGLPVAAQPKAKTGPSLPAPAQANPGGALQMDYADAPAPAVDRAPAYRPPTEAEIRESQRRADEAARIIEATTPEM